MTTTFSPKDPTEAIYYGIDFSALLGDTETVSSATATMRVTSGTDANAAAMISGSPTITGGVVKQKIISGIAGNVYLFSISAVTSAGQTFVEAAPLKVLERD